MQQECDMIQDFGTFIIRLGSPGLLMRERTDDKRVLNQGLNCVGHTQNIL